MPARPANINGSQDILSAVNQLIRELQIRVDNINKTASVHRTLMATGTLNFGAIPPQQAVSRNVQVAGATQSAAASASPQLNLGNPHLTWCAQVLSSGVVQVNVLNPTGGTVSPNTVTWNVSVIS